MMSLQDKLSYFFKKAEMICEVANNLNEGDIIKLALEHRDGVGVRSKKFIKGKLRTNHRHA